MKTVPHFIEGKTFSLPDETRLPVRNPANGETLRDVGIASQATVAKAVDAAKKAFQLGPKLRLHVVLVFYLNTNDVSKKTSKNWHA